MAFLLDTPTVAEILRTVPSRALVRHLSETPTRERWTSVITVSQLLVTARRSNQARLMQDVVQVVAALRVAPFDMAAAQVFAKFRAGPAAELDADDVMIAAIALSAKYTLVTKRTSAFSVFTGLRVENWFV
jgi:tRNA(fMet)-specific endonuclease VapC